MTDLHARARAARTKGTALCVAALCIASGAALAQRSPRPTAVERRLEHLNRQAEQRQRDDMSRGDKPAADEPGAHRASKATAEQVKKDFEGLQAGYNRIITALASKRGLDYDSVASSVEEVHRCATRLKSHLALPHPEGDEKEAERATAARAKTGESLKALCKHVYDFVTNPLFESSAGLDAEQAARAGRDLELVIELSEEIRRGVHESKKAAKH